DLRIGKGHVDLVVEFVDDPGGRVLGRADAIPTARLVARHEFAHGRNVWGRFRAHRGGYGERTQLAGPDVFDRRRHGGEYDLHLSPDQIGECRRDATIGHVDQL